MLLARQVSLPPAVAGGTPVEGVEAEGRTVNEATDRALTDLGLSREQVDVEVLTEGRPRLLGFRGEPARVRVTPRAVAPVQQSRPVEDEYDEDDEDEYEDEEEDEDEEEYEDDEELEDGDDEEEYEEEEEEELPPAVRRTPVATVESKALPLDAEDVQVAVTVLENLLELMGVDADVTPRSPETAGDGVGMIEAVLDVEGDDLGILIGRRGQTQRAPHRSYDARGGPGSHDREHRRGRGAQSRDHAHAITVPDPVIARRGDRREAVAATKQTPSRSPAVRSQSRRVSRASSAS
jgi:predicted RNA-binding protein Jag